jgi:hypothetical protein
MASGPWEKYAAPVAAPAEDGPWAKYSQPEAPPYDPSAGGGTLQFGPWDTGIKTPESVERGLAGVGKAFADVGRGAGQWLGMVSRDDVAESRRLDAPLMNTTAGTVGNIVGNVAMLAPTAMIPGANTVAGAGVVGAVAGAAQPSVSTRETLTNTGFGAAAGAAGQKVANVIGNKLAQIGKPNLSKGQEVALRKAEALGMKATPGQQTGSRALQKVEAALESNPMTSGGFDAVRNQNQAALNRAAAKAIGENADELSAPVLQQAEQRIGKVFDQVKNIGPVPIDPKVTNALAGLVRDTDGLIGNNASLADNALIQRFDEFAFQGGATGEQLRSLSSKMGKAAKNAMTSPMGDRELGAALFQAKELVDDSIESALPGALQKSFGEARGQYRNLMSLTAKTNVVNPSSGNVQGRSLANALMSKDRGGFTMGRNDTDMYNAARFFQAFPGIVGDSGTATRKLGAADYLASIPTNLLTRAYLSAPVSAAARGASTGTQMIGRAVGPALPRMAPLGSIPAGLSAADLTQQ